jgi:hypothetical protein
MLAQSAANDLFDIPKVKKSDESYGFPRPGKKLTIPITSHDGQEDFLIDISRARIRLTKCTYQERCHQMIILVRLDLGGPPHTNPEVASVPLPCLTPHNGLTIDCPHLHVYVEGFMDKWAIPAPNDKFPDTHNLYTTLQDFFSYCNVVEPPKVHWEVLLNEF